MPITPVSDLRSFFANAVDRAVERCRVALEPAECRHLATVLADGSNGRGQGDSIVVELERTLDLSQELQLAPLVALGDRALFLSGFVGRESDDAVCRRCGPFAYARASTITRDDSTSALYAGMAQRFDVMTHVLAEVAVAQSLGAETRDLVRIYDAWKRSKSPSALDAMAREGVFPHEDGEAEA